MTRVSRLAITVALVCGVSPPAASQVRIVPAPWVDGSGVARGTVTVPVGGALRIAMAQPSSLAATPSQLGTDLAAGVYTLTVTALDAGGGQTDDPTAITCTVAAGGAGRCAVTWTAVPGAVSYRVWTSLVNVATPTRYFAATTNSYNLDTLTGATVATLPTAGTAYAVDLGADVFQLPINGVFRWGSDLTLTSLSNDDGFHSLIVARNVANEGVRIRLRNDDATAASHRAFVMFDAIANGAVGQFGQYGPNYNDATYASFLKFSGDAAGLLLRANDPSGMLKILVGGGGSARERMRITATDITLDTATTTRGGVKFLEVDNPAAPSLAAVGAGGATTWGYRVTATTGLGESARSTETTVLGNATLTTDNYVEIGWAAVTGATGYRVYRTTAGGTPNTTGLIGSTNAVTRVLNDTGLVAGAAAPTVNTTGFIYFGSGYLLKPVASDQIYVRTGDDANYADIAAGKASLVAVRSLNGAPATAGLLRAANAEAIVTVRNAGASANATLLSTDANNSTYVGGITVTIAQNARAKVATVPLGLLVIRNATDTTVALFSLVGTGATTEISDPSNTYTITKDGAGTVNVYYDTDGVYVQNNLAASKDFSWTVIGS